MMNRSSRTLVVSVCSILALLPAAVHLRAGPLQPAKSALVLKVHRAEDSDLLRFEFQHQQRDWDFIAAKLKRALQLDEGLDLNVFVAGDLRVRDLNNLLKQLCEMGWKKVKLNLLIEGHLACEGLFTDDIEEVLQQDE